ncbi:MAG: TetR/AcrR family transcriptional regulator [Thiotrichales bacterium]
MNPVNDTRQRLLGCARDLLYSRSYGHVGVKEICDAARVQKGSFYHFFPSKQALALAVLDEYFVEFKEDIFSRSFLPDFNPMQRLAALIDNIYDFQLLTREQTGKTLGCPYGNIVSEMATLDEPIRLRVAAFFEKVEAEIQATLDEAVARSEIATCNTKATAAAMFSYIEGLMLLAKTRNDPELVRTLGPAMLGIRVEGAAAD